VILSLPDNLEVNLFSQWYGHYILLTVITNEALVLPCDMDWVLGIETSPDNDTCRVVGLQLGYEEQENPPNVLLAARAATSCLINQIAAPSAAAFLLSCRG